MCGISGYVDIQNGIKTWLLKEMTDIIRHRGPDDEGFALIHENGEMQFAAGRDTISAMRSMLVDIAEIKEEDSFWDWGIEDCQFWIYQLMDISR